jgi:galactose mutarotase-like enzyme
MTVTTGLTTAPSSRSRACGREIRVTFNTGFAAAQVFSPPGAPFICFEPMTAPTNALCSGAGLRWVAPGDAFTAAFTIAVS